MAEILRLSGISAAFPEIIVEYEDIFAMKYRLGGRGTDGTIDCVGVVIEVFRRAGLGIPDPECMAGGIAEFADLFEPVAEPDHLFDVAFWGSPHQHAMIFVRPGVALSAAKAGGYVKKLSFLKKFPEVEFYRVRSNKLPT
jgi:hypothetical protein